MYSINNLNIAGHVTKDAITYRTRAGQLVSHITVALNRRYRTAAGEYEEATTFVDVTLWGRQAEFACDNILRGDFVHVEGRLDTDRWTDPRTPQPRQKLVVTGSSVTMQKKAPRPSVVRAAPPVAAAQSTDLCPAGCT
ncbi:MAG: single-stranded DNA-binding protein [Planctomycetota bacterium]|jgi:single-strand DNA-binding protein